MAETEGRKMSGVRKIGDLVAEAQEKGEASSTATAKRGEPSDSQKEAKQKVKDKQKELPGMETPRVKALDELGEMLRVVRSKRMKLTKEESEAANKILTLMKKKKIRRYRLDEESEIAIEPSEFNVKVRKIKVPKDPSSIPRKGKKKAR